MNFNYKRSYKGPIEAVLLDWAGTTMDFGCMAPARVFVEVFKRKNVPITIEEARAPMGAHKRVHIQRITELESVHTRWMKTHGRPPTDGDVSAMFAEFVPLQVACLSEYSTLIPGTLEVIAELRRRGIKIGSTSGYLPEMMRVNQQDAKRQGYEPDATVCAGDVPAGRPFPHMCLLNVVKLGVSTVQACVKIDDTVPGVEEGLNAGMWTIGLAVSGNEVGMTLKDWTALTAAEQA
ncbi:MAG: phosphonoacetaldehyde hydrolase, partial [Betaproteobacteria bacterium CG2_30_68_42]